MINIYHKDKMFLFCSTNEADEIRKKVEIESYEVLEPDATLADSMEAMEADPTTGALIVEGLRAFDLLNAFALSFKRKVAAGGLVQNGKGEYLMIFRHGFWDLPKGKVEKGETWEEAAIREVEEETGITNITLGEGVKLGIDQANCTYHTFERKGKPILKQSAWYHMSIEGSQATIPQAEEGIEKAIWVPKSGLSELLPLCYGSIQDVLNVILDKQ